MGGIRPSSATAIRDLRAGDVAAMERFVRFASFAPGRHVTAEEAAAPRVRRWLEGWPTAGDAGVGWEAGGRLRGAAWARVVEPVLVRDRSGAALPELIVAVDEEVRGRGIGTALVAALAECARARSWPGLALTVSPRNPPAVAVYRRCGFAKVQPTAPPPLPGLLVMALWFEGADARG